MLLVMLLQIRTQLHLAAIVLGANVTLPILWETCTLDLSKLRTRTCPPQPDTEIGHNPIQPAVSIGPPALEL
jgi:hypothetical protein